MRVINASVTIITPIDPDTIMRKLELAGRTCYKSEEKITENSAEVFLCNIIKKGHEAVLEHQSITIKFIVDRGVSHEIVRHRLASYCQESTRYCNYTDARFGNEVTFIRPCFLCDDPNSEPYHIWVDSCLASERAYFKLLNAGCTAQEARTVLPNSLKTEIVMTANIREWRHFLRLRCSAAAHPQMREVANKVLEIFSYKLPVLFEDIKEEIKNEYESGTK